MSLRGGFDAQEARSLQAAYRALSLVPAHGSPAAIFDALAHCVPVVAGTIALLRPGATDALTHHGVRLPDELLDAWMCAPPEQMDAVCARMIRARAGELQLEAELAGEARSAQAKARPPLDGYGLGEVASYKVMHRSALGHGAEHVSLVLCAARGVAFPPRAGLLLAELHPAIQAALLRLELPLIAREPIVAQIVAEQMLGYVCLSSSGILIESNRRAHLLTARYQGYAGLMGRRSAITDLAQRARERSANEPRWRLCTSDGASVLDIHVHRLSRDFHALSDDVLLVSMRAWSTQPSVADALAGLTPRQRQITLLLARKGMSYKEIAGAVGVQEGTVRKHAERIYRVLGVHSRAELGRLFR